MEIVIKVRKSFTLNGRSHPANTKVSGIIKIIIKEIAHLGLHQARIYCQVNGTDLSSFKKLSIHTGKNTANILATIQRANMIITKYINPLKKSICRSVTMSPNNKKTSELAIKAINHQNFSIKSVIFGLILYLP